MQVDGADDFDDNDDVDFDADASGDDSSNLSFPGTRCPICDEPTKMHKTYHLATRHFKQRLIDTLQSQTVVTETGKTFRCPECGQDFKSRINLWTHYLGKHRFGEKWSAELTSQTAATPAVALLAAAVVKQEEVESAPAAAAPAAAVFAVKSEPKPDPEDDKARTPTKKSSSSRSSLDFWCDLCQSLVTNSARPSHFASTHFDGRLKQMLPTAGVFSCPLCRHEGKNFSNLSSHFLGKHVEFMKKWLREELEKLEEAAIKKLSNPEDVSGQAKHDLSSEDEFSTSVSTALASNPPLRSCLMASGGALP